MVVERETLTYLILLSQQDGITEYPAEKYNPWHIHPSVNALSIEYYNREATSMSISRRMGKDDGYVYTAEH